MKLQVMDEVVVTGDTRHYRHDLSPGTFATIEHLSEHSRYGLLATVRTETGVRRKVHTEDLRLRMGYLRDPQVPDADGNPIRPGQLVENVTSGELKFAREVAHQRFAEPGIKVDDHDSRFGSRWSGAHLWRTVGSTFRPPEPDPRDVTLRVTVTTEPDMPVDLVRDGVESSINSGWPSLRAVTVEVVDDG